MCDFSHNTLIDKDIFTYLLDCQARNLSPNTTDIYQIELRLLAEYLSSCSVYDVAKITTEQLRAYFTNLATRRVPGGVHGAFRSTRAFLNWWEREFEPPPTWRNPISRLSAPRINTEPRAGIPMEDVRKLLLTCEKTLVGQRDRAIILTLLDTGLRKSEFVSLMMGDIDLPTGIIHLPRGKGGKSRVVFVGLAARKEIMKYLRKRKAFDLNSPLWINKDNQTLTPAGLRQMIRRRSQIAGIKDPALHSFRRTFAIQCLRNGMDLVTLARLMGHANVSILQRYLKLVEDDLAAAHASKGPVDHL
jgi:integrase/recombinase XerC/integrase/recombinase XerD